MPPTAAAALLSAARVMRLSEMSPMVGLVLAVQRRQHAD
jgi:hypothetical protein